MGNWTKGRSNPYDYAVGRERRGSGGCNGCCHKIAARINEYVCDIGVITNGRMSGCSGWEETPSPPVDKDA